MIRLFLETPNEEIDLLRRENGDVIMPHIGKWPTEDSKTYTYQFPEAIVGFAHPELDTYGNDVVRLFNAICDGDDVRRNLGRIASIFQMVWIKKIDYYTELQQKLTPEDSEFDPKSFDESSKCKLFVEIDGKIEWNINIGFIDHGLLRYRKYKKVFA